MKVGVIGSGIVGQTLAEGFLHHGHEVMVGTRDAAKLAEWGKAHSGVQLGSSAEAAAFAELIVLAVKGNAAAEALRLAGKQNLERKVIIDATNPIDGPPVNGILPFFTTQSHSLMEQLQEEFPAARFVKAFNSVGYQQFINPAYDEGRPTMFLCGNDPAAKKVVTHVLEQFGWESADMGGVTSARAVEPLCVLWCAQGFLHNEWTHAFKMLHAKRG
jgi:predicted dinucleotide-binding enzyme